MNGRRQRPAVGGSAEVVSIGAGSTYRPDFSQLACGQVAAARHVLDLDHTGFARLIGDMLGWDIAPDLIASWEDDATPPGDVLLACAAASLASGELPGLAIALLATIPPAFPAETLAGLWVTSYQFSHNGRPQHHADIAHVTVLAGNQVRIVNHPPEPRSEGRGRSFRNEIHASLAGRHLIGQWRNTSDTRYFGALQLAAHPGETVMEGYYLGVGSDIQVSAGAWKWVRLDATAADLAGVDLRDPAEVYELVQAHSQYGGPLLLAEIREGA